jgi:drug/metabolite transporter (DMT)-like permease
MATTDDGEAPLAARRPLRRFATAPYVLLTLCMLFWAGNAVVGKAVVGVVPPLSLSFLRWLIALAIIVPFGLTHVRNDFSAVRAQWRTLFMLALFSVVAFNTLLYVALKWTTAINASLVGATGPAVIPLIAWILLRERVSPRQAVGIAVSFVGVLIVITRGELGVLANLGFNQGDLLVLSAVVAWSIYSVLLRRHSASLHPLTFLTVTFAFGLAIITPFSAWEYANGARMHLSALSLGGIAYVGIFPSLFSFLFWNRGVTAIGASRAAQFLYLVPVFAAALAIVFLGESLEFYHVVGIALIFVGLQAATRKSRAPRADDGR